MAPTATTVLSPIAQTQLVWNCQSQLSLVVDIVCEQHAASFVCLYMCSQPDRCVYARVRCALCDMVLPFGECVNIAQYTRLYVDALAVVPHRNWNRACMSERAFGSTRCVALRQTRRTRLRRSNQLSLWAVIICGIFEKNRNNFRVLIVITIKMYSKQKAWFWIKRFCEI